MKNEMRLFVRWDAIAERLRPNKGRHDCLSSASASPNRDFAQPGLRMTPHSHSVRVALRNTRFIYIENFGGTV